ncbi:MAG: AMP-binding protein [Akkermansiaceae bacterium]
MDTAYLTSHEFWQSIESHILVNDRDPQAVAESEEIKTWLDSEPRLAAHLLFATSGSTGGSKWVALSRAAILASAKAVNQHIGATQHDVWLLALPVFHVGGMGVLARCYETDSSLIHLEEKWSASAYHTLATDKEATLSSLVPTQLVDIVKAGLNSPKKMRGLFIGGGRLDDATYQKASALGWPIIETYGMTETASQIATTQPGSKMLKTLPNLELKLSHDGKLMVKGTSLMTGYVYRAFGKWTFQAQENWFTTNDLVRLDSRALYIIGRADRCIKVLGELVNLAHIEEKLQQLASELNTSLPPFCIAAPRDERAGHQLHLIHENTNDRALDEVIKILEHYHRQCLPFQRISSIHQIDEIPRSPLGKVRYSQLSELLQQKIK